MNATDNAQPLQLVSPLGLIAGNGIFPFEFAESAKSKGISVVAAAHKGETRDSLGDCVDKCLWVRLGQLGKIIRFFRKNGVKQAAFAGGIPKPRVFGGGLRPDLAALRLIPRIKSLKDDSLLRAIAAEFERNGIQIVPASALLEKSVPGEGVLTRRGLTPGELEDARMGWEAARETGRLDIGQSVVVNKKVVVAVEAAEGTDAAIERAGAVSGPGCVLVKLAKPQQDLRFDLPTIGENTVHNMQKIGGTAIVVEAGKSLILDPQKVITLADRAGIAIVSAVSV